MKNKLYIIILIIISAVTTVFAVLLININNTYAGYKGTVPGTGFFKQEMAGAVSNVYDVDSKGNIYFANADGYILIYDSEGKYLYTLSVMPGNSVIYVKVDNDDNIVALDSKAHKLYIFNQNGQLTNTIDNISNDDRNEFVYYSSVDKRSKPNGIEYNYNNGTITKTLNGQTTIVFTIPEWQKVVGPYTFALVISIGAIIVMLLIKFIM